MARITVTTVKVVDDLTGAEVNEDAIETFDWTHPVTGAVYVLETSPDAFAKFQSATETAATAWKAAQEAAQAAYDKAMEKAQATYDAAMNKASNGRAAELVPVKAAGTSQASKIAVGKAKTAWLQTEEANELGNPGIRALIRARQQKGNKGPWPEALTDFLAMHEELWHPDHKKN